MPEFSFSLSEIVGYIATILTIGAAWADLRSRSISNSSKIDDLSSQVEKDFAEVHERIEKTEMWLTKTEAKVEMQSDKFNDYRERAAQTFVTVEQLGTMKRELVEQINGTKTDMITEFRRLGDRMDRMNERKIPPAE